MTELNRLREVIATMLMVSPDQVTSDTSLVSLDSSLGGARLRLALKRAGLEWAVSNSVPTTFGALEAALAGGSTFSRPVLADTAAATVEQFSGRPPASLQIGIDLQQIGELPAVTDYWAHELYREVFADTELAYAVVKNEPRVHLAGFWCAKEALRKCDPSFARASLASTAVAHSEDGKPYLCSVTSAGSFRLPHAVSISHSGSVASAVVIAAGGAAQSSAPNGRGPLPDTEAGVPTDARSPTRLGALLMIVITVVLLLSIVFVYQHR